MSESPRTWTLKGWSRVRTADLPSRIVRGVLDRDEQVEVVELGRVLDLLARIDANFGFIVAEPEIFALLDEIRALLRENGRLGEC